MLVLDLQPLHVTCTFLIPSQSSNVTVQFGSCRVEQIYREEQLRLVKVLTDNLDRISLSGSAFTQDLRQQFVADVSSVAQDTLIFVDETGTNHTDTAEIWLQF